MNTLNEVKVLNFTTKASQDTISGKEIKKVRVFAAGKVVTIDYDKSMSQNAIQNRIDIKVVGAILASMLQTSINVKAGYKK